MTFLNERIFVSAFSLSLFLIGTSGFAADDDDRPRTVLSKGAHASDEDNDLNDREPLSIWLTNLSDENKALTEKYVQNLGTKHREFVNKHSELFLYRLDHWTGMWYFEKLSKIEEPRLDAFSAAIEKDAKYMFTRGRLELEKYIASKIWTLEELSRLSEETLEVFGENVDLFYTDDMDSRERIRIIEAVESYTPDDLNRISAFLRDRPNLLPKAPRSRATILTWLLDKTPEQLEQKIETINNNQFIFHNLQEEQSRNLKIALIAYDFPDFEEELPLLEQNQEVLLPGVTRFKFYDKPLKSYIEYLQNLLCKYSPDDILKIAQMLRDSTDKSQQLNTYNLVLRDNLDLSND